jgi:membrane dipeptidase
MKNLTIVSLFFLFITQAAFGFGADQPLDPLLWQKALKLNQESIVVDTHCDTPMLAVEKNLNLGVKTDKTEVDFVRMKEGGVAASFFAVFVSNSQDDKKPAKKALEMIDEIYLQVEAHPGLAALAFSPGDIRRIHALGKRAILIGMENGSPLEGSLRLLRNYQRLGVRYITLTHSNNNGLCDSSTAEEPRWNGLSDFGKGVVLEMNRLGMIVDVSHLSDKTFYDVLAVSKAPVMASHSCARALNDVPRNMTDDMIKALAAKGGVMQINFYSAFLDPGFRKNADKVEARLKPEFDTLKEKFKDNSSAYWDAVFTLWKANAPEAPDITVLIDHIDHVVKLVGADYVGLGSDFDGAGSYPKGLEDVSKFPHITYHLLQRGYSESDIKKILGGNFMRVFAQVEKTAALR